MQNQMTDNVKLARKIEYEKVLAAIKEKNNEHTGRD